LLYYSRNPDHPLVKSTPLSEFDKDLQKFLLDDLNIKADFQEYLSYGYDNCDYDYFIEFIVD